jgi:hypothetical protein
MGIPIPATTSPTCLAPSVFSFSMVVCKLSVLGACLVKSIQLLDMLRLKRLHVEHNREMRRSLVP